MTAKDFVSKSPGMTPVTSPGPNKGPFPKEVRVRLTEQQHACLDTIRGNDSCARYVRDRLFYASPGELSVIGAIGSVYQAAGKVIEAAEEIKAQTAKLERTMAYIAAIAEHQPGAPSPGLPSLVVHAIEPVREQAAYLLALAQKFERLASEIGAEEMRRGLAEKPQPDIKPRPRPER